MREGYRAAPEQSQRPIAPGTVASVPSTERVTAALDVGGTSIKSGVVRGEDVELLTTVPSRSGEVAEVVIGQLLAASGAAIATAGPALSALAIAVPRPFDLERGIPLLRGLHKFEAIHGVELRPILRDRTGIGARPITFVGDAEAAAVGEARFGAGRGVDRVLTITLGTGMGACLTDRGAVVTAVGDAVVEDLHDRATPDGRADDVFSARGMAEHLDVDPTSLPAAIMAEGSSAVLGDFGRRLGAFLSPIMREFDADTVVIGGGLAGSFDRFGPAMSVPAFAASLGARGPLLGAAALAAID
jgi:glucokinase